MKRANRLTQEQLDELEALNNLPEDQINTDDVPEVREWAYFRRGALYRPDDAGDGDGEGANRSKG